MTYAGQETESWDVLVALSDSPQVRGHMTIHRECGDGGTFESTLPVLAKYIFTSLKDSTFRPLDMGVLGIDPIIFSAKGV